jgi:hypothetical protein
VQCIANTHESVLEESLLAFLIIFSFKDFGLVYIAIASNGFSSMVCRPWETPVFKYPIQILGIMYCMHSFDADWARVAQ